MKKIDAHLHVAAQVAGYCRRGELRAIGGGRAAWGNGEEFQLFPPEYGDRSFTIEKAMEIMDAHGVEKAVLMQGSMYGFQNRYHEEIMERYPERFCPSCTVDPFMTNRMDIVRRFFEEKHFRLMKLELSSGGGLMGCHEPFLLAEPRMMELYSIVAAHGGTLALDIGERDMESHQLSQVSRIAEAFPGLKLVVCHLLAPKPAQRPVWERGLALLKKENIWFDIAALPKIMAPVSYPYPEVVDCVRAAIDIVGVDRLLWGTDAPYAAVQDSYTRLTDYLEASGSFTEAELAAMYYQNSELVYFS